MSHHFRLTFLDSNHAYLHNNVSYIYKNNIDGMTVAEQGIRASQWNKKGKLAKVQQYYKGIKKGRKIVD